MSLAINLYHDQLDESGSSSGALPAVPRILFVRHGTAIVNGQVMNADDSAFCDTPVTLKSSGAWSEIWRWDLVAPNLPPMLHEGAGVLSMVRMQRAIANFAMIKGTKWLFRLDRIMTPAGRVADRHQHPGPGMRCLVEGTFNVRQSIESYSNIVPGEPWWESGTDTVIAWASQQMGAKFMRAMVLPTEWEGKVTGEWLSGAPPARKPGSWKLYVDQIVTIA